MILGIDHIAMTVADLEATCRFYATALDAVIEDSYDFGGKLALRRVAIGKAILSIHQQGNGIDLVAQSPLPGSTDICFRWDGPIETAQARLEGLGIEAVEGPVPRTAADGRHGQSIYFRDPDGNLVELLAA